MEKHDDRMNQEMIIPEDSRYGVILPDNINNNSLSWNWGLIIPAFLNTDMISHVRFYNVSPVQEPFDIYINNQLVAPDLEYMAATQYFHVLPGRYLITIYQRTNPGVPILNSWETFRPKTFYTVMITGSSRNYALQIVNP